LRSGEDVGLRLLALERLGPLAHPFAREALERGTLEVEPDILAWQGSLGEIHGHLVVLWLDQDLFIRVSAFPAVVDALTTAVAAAVARTPGNSLAELRIRLRKNAPSHSPYRTAT
jgi:hypothetical protein